MEKLIKVQLELKAPKNQYNAFGKYKYRNAEDILEAVKPLLAKYNLTMTISDIVKEVGNRIYVVSTVKISDGEQEEFVDAWAREPETQKGMNDSQITGAASSYARKYALNGMFCIDDTKDADSMDNEKQPENTKSEEKKKPEVKINWLTDEQFNIALSSDLKSIKAVLTKYSSDTFKMKKEFKEKLEAKFKELTSKNQNNGSK